MQTGRTFNFQFSIFGLTARARTPARFKALRTLPWPPPKNGQYYVVPEVAELLTGAPNIFGLRGDYLSRARSLGYLRKKDNAYYHAAKRWAIDPSSLHLMRGKPRYVRPGSDAATGAVPGGGPTTGYLACKQIVDREKRKYWAKKGINEVRPAAKNTVRGPVWESQVPPAPVAWSAFPCMISMSTTGTVRVHRCRPQPGRSCSPHAQKPYPLIPSPHGVASRPARLAAVYRLATFSLGRRSAPNTVPRLEPRPAAPRCVPPRGPRQNLKSGMPRSARSSPPLGSSWQWAQPNSCPATLPSKKVLCARSIVNSTQHSNHTTAVSSCTADARPFSFAPCRVPHASRVCWGCIPPAHPQQCHACVAMRRPFNPP